MVDIGERNKVMKSENSTISMVKFSEFFLKKTFLNCRCLMKLEENKSQISEFYPFFDK